jgi:lipoyl-dependent peroxiredoxin
VITISKLLYTARATAEGGRRGRTTTDDGRLDLTMVPPPEMGGPEGEDGTNPEQLFAAGFASCFHSALKLVARRMKLDPEGSTVTAAVGIGPGEGVPGYALTVDLTVHMPNVADPEAAQQLVDTTHHVCPYSNATRGNIEVTLSIA